jgi:hypothetical protein
MHGVNAGRRYKGTRKLVLDLSTPVLPFEVVASRSGSTVYAARSASTAIAVSSGPVFEDHGGPEGGGWWTFPGYSNRVTKPFDHSDVSWTKTGTNTLTLAAVAGPASGGPAADRFVDADATFPSELTFNPGDSVNCIDSAWEKASPSPNQPTAHGALDLGGATIGVNYSTSDIGWRRVSAGRGISAPGVQHKHVAAGLNIEADGLGQTPSATGGIDVWGDSQVLGFSDLPLVDGTTGDCTLQIARSALPALINNGDIDITVRFLADYLDNPATSNAGTQNGGWIFSMYTPAGLFGMRYDVTFNATAGTFVLVAAGADLLSVSLDSFPGGTVIDARMVYQPSTLTAALLASYNGCAQMVTGAAGSKQIETPSQAWIGSNLGASSSIMPRRWQRLEAR